jgi:signal transduction histidine kinase/ligand-binding sensor domain-containing protein/DNA-binding response OmpR family regulator
MRVFLFFICFNFWSCQKKVLTLQAKCYIRKPKMLLSAKKLVAATTICLAALTMKAQTGQFFDNEHQLSSSFVTQVYVDRAGFLWVTTRDGINRYDGYQFQVFRRENAADSTLASNYVNSIMQDSRGLFYIGMYGALQTWDGCTFRNVTMKDLDGKPSRCYATCFLERSNGEMLAGTSGLGVMRFTGPQSAQQMGGPLAKLHTVNAMHEDRHGRLWLLTDQHGLVCLDGENTTEYMTGRNDLSGLCEDREGHLYVGTINSGVYRQEGDTFQPISGTGGKAVATIYCNHEGLILIGYDGSGLAIYDPHTGEVTDNPFFSRDVDLSKSKVLSLAEDNSGNLWMGMLQKGLYKQPRRMRAFHYMGHKNGPKNTIGSAFVVCTLVDRQGRLWIGTDKDGIYCQDTQSGHTRHLFEGYPSVVMTLREQADGRIWVGSYREGFGWIDPVTMQYHRQPFADEHLIVTDMAFDSHNQLWLATMKYGLMCMQLSDGTITKYMEATGANINRQVNSIVNDFVSQMQLSPNGKRIYVSTSMGTCCFDIEAKSWVSAFNSNSLRYGEPVRVTKELNDTLWLATSQGLFCYSLNGQLLRQYTRDDGLADNAVASIERDAQGRLWLGTNHGLSCLTPATGEVNNYYADNGLQGNEFGEDASFQCSDGTIILGGTGGITWFQPQEVKPRKWQADVHITGFLVDGIQINAETRSGSTLVTDSAITISSLFRLSHDDNSFAIQLSTLTYDNPEHTTFLYSINGEPFTRLQPGQNVISFSHMPAGTYRFRVKAEHSGQATAERHFTVVVRAPWYRTTWALILYGVLLIAAIAAYLGYRRRKERDRLRLQEHIHAEEMADAKLRFFINMSHEIRTPMTLIVTPLQELIKTETDPQRLSVYETIRRNAGRILGIINQMMDLRKIDKGLMQMRMKETDLVAFVKDAYSLFQHQAATRQIKLLFEPDTDSLPVWIDRKHFDKVIINLLSNAFKYTPAGGEIVVRLTHDDTHARIAVSDNGEQIPADQLERVFERFYQSPTKLNDQNAGTGVGLDLTRSLVELHHGTIEASNLQKGCQFTITLPLGCSHLKPEEMIVEGSNTEDNQEGAEGDDTLGQELLGLEQQQQQHLPLEGRKTGRPVIVIAEDDDEIRQYLADELASVYDVHACVNGRIALSEVYKTQPDLVLSDVMMPEMDGHALCQKLKMNHATSHIPVVLLTAKNSDEDRLEGLDIGADAYLVKPFNMDILRRTVANLINSRQQLKLKYARNDALEEQIQEVERPKSPDDKLLERVMAVINKNLSDADLSVDAIADEVGISRVHLHRKMKELTGQTPHDFIRNLRLKRAATLLAAQGMNVTEVMYACGFSNSTSFSTIFKKFYGMSPREYMREHAKSETV